MAQSKKVSRPSDFRCILSKLSLCMRLICTLEEGPPGRLFVSAHRQHRVLPRDVLRRAGRDKDRRSHVFALPVLLSWEYGDHVGPWDAVWDCLAHATWRLQEVDRLDFVSAEHIPGVLKFHTVPRVLIKQLDRRHYNANHWPWDKALYCASSWIQKKVGRFGTGSRNRSLSRDGWVHVERGT